MDCKIFAKTIEDKALDQLREIVHHPAFVNSKIRIMPDVHAGKGCVIGFTAELKDKVVPNIVGVDIGCGMRTVELGDVDIDYAELDSFIKENIPSGREVSNTHACNVGILQELYCYNSLNDIHRIIHSIGTLGGENHFIEIDVDSYGNKYLVIHTGSRNLGKQVAEYYQSVAVVIQNKLKKDCLRKEQKALIDWYKKRNRSTEIADAICELKKKYAADGCGLPDDLCYLSGNDMVSYLHDMRICQDFAVINRYVIADDIVKHLFGKSILEAGLSTFETVHNYIEYRTNIVRKGAISAEAGEKVLIPMNMHDGCIIGIGKGNPDWNCSAPHGAGRIMSRSKARKDISLKEYEESMNGIYTTSVCQSTIDESPMAYKPMDEIVKSIEDTVLIDKIIKPVYNFKASE